MCICLLLLHIITFPVSLLLVCCFSLCTYLHVSMSGAACFLSAGSDLTNVFHVYMFWLFSSSAYAHVSWFWQMATAPVFGSDRSRETFTFFLNVKLLKLTICWKLAPFKWKYNQSWIQSCTIHRFRKSVTRRHQLIPQSGQLFCSTKAAEEPSLLWIWWICRISIKTAMSSV